MKALVGGSWEALVSRFFASSAPASAGAFMTVLVLLGNSLPLYGLSAILWDLYLSKLRCKWLGESVPEVEVKALAF